MFISRHALLESTILDFTDIQGKWRSLSCSEFALFSEAKTFIPITCRNGYGSFVWYSLVSNPSKQLMLNVYILLFIFSSYCFILHVFLLI